MMIKSSFEIIKDIEPEIIHSKKLDPTEYELYGKEWVDKKKLMTLLYKLDELKIFIPKKLLVKMIINNIEINGGKKK